MIIPLSIYNEDMYHDVISAISFQAVALIRSQFKSAPGHGNRNSFNMNKITINTIPNWVISRVKILP